MEKPIMWLYGKSGYGKTAAALAIAEEFKKVGKSVCPLTSEELLNQFVEFLQKHGTSEDLYSLLASYNLIIADDFDILLYGKIRTQEFFKSLFLKLARENNTKIIIITERVPPVLPSFQLSRENCEYYQFPAPSLETKKELLQKWSRKMKKQLQPTTYESLAKSTDNLFALRGALTRTMH